MTTRSNDSISDSLDRLAGLADTDPVGDRMPDIQRRVRVARRRRGAGAVAAAVAVAVGGLGVWQGLPAADTAPPVTDPDGGHWQEISVDARSEGPGRLRVSFTVTGQSSAYTDARTGEPSGYAGPQLTHVIVDGQPVATSEEPGLVCRPGGAPTPYSRSFHVDEPLVVPVTPGDTHTVVVQAPHCEDGELVDLERVVTVRGEVGGFTTTDRARVDLDGDGATENVRLLVPDDVESDLELRVGWGTGETTTASLPNTMETSLRDPADLDADGDLELIAFGGGGETSVHTVFQADPGSLQPVRVVDASGEDTVLAADADPAAWQVHVGADAVLSYRLTDPTTTEFPAPVEVRRWSLVGGVLTEARETTTRCMTLQPNFVLGPC